MKINYVNSTMDEIYDYVASLYEALMDGEKEEVEKICINIQSVIRDVRRSNNER